MNKMASCPCFFESALSRCCFPSDGYHINCVHAKTWGRKTQLHGNHQGTIPKYLNPPKLFRESVHETCFSVEFSSLFFSREMVSSLHGFAIIAPNFSSRLRVECVHLRIFYVCKLHKYCTFKITSWIYPAKWLLFEKKGHSVVIKSKFQTKYPFNYWWHFYYVLWSMHGVAEETPWQ